MENKLTKYMTIGIAEDDQCGVQVSPDMDAATAFQLLGTLALHLLNAFYAVAEASITKDSTLTKQADKDAASLGIKESMYDAADSIFSTVLAQFYPDAPRNEIEEEAILELVNQKIEERYNRLPNAEKKAFKAKYNMMKLRMQLTPRKKVQQNEQSTDSETSERA